MLCRKESFHLPWKQPAPLLQSCSVVFINCLSIEHLYIQKFCNKPAFFLQFSLVKAQFIQSFSCLLLLLPHQQVPALGGDCSHAKQFLFVFNRMAPVRRQSCDSSSSWLGPITGCQNTPPQSWLSCDGSRPVTQQMLGPWLCIAGRTVCLPSGCRSFNLSERGVSPSCGKGFMVA